MVAIILLYMIVLLSISCFRLFTNASLGLGTSPVYIRLDSTLIMVVVILLQHCSQSLHMEEMVRSTLTDALHMGKPPRMPLQPSHVRMHSAALWQGMRRDPFRHLRALQLALHELAEDIDAGYEKHGMQ
jgi:hypothetical protein